jgi:hypothetical protein
MKTVVFENEGVIDVRSIKIFGVSVKETSNPIGHFGTGLKYAIAILLRHAQEVTIEADNELFLFGIKKQTIRGKEFDTVTMNGVELPFTTELGKGWEFWQAFREIYCNMIDEKGKVYLADSDCRGGDTTGKTKVFIRGAEVLNTYFEKDTIVLNLPESEKIHDGKVEIYNKPSRFVYYRGVRVWKPAQPTMLTYNIVSETELTEDRTLKNVSVAINRIMGQIAKLKDVEVIRKLVTDREHYESKLEYMGMEYWLDDNQTSEEFENVVKEYFEANSDRLNASIRGWYRQKMNKDSLKSYQIAQMTDIEKRQLNRCVDICKRSLRDFAEYDIMVVKTLGEMTMAIAEVDQQRIVISKRVFEMGTRYLLSTLIEEYSHIKTGFNDCTREFQTHIFDTLCTVIEDHVIKEPV